MKTYNYKGIFEEPVTLYRLGKFSLPFGVPLARVVIALLILAIMFRYRTFFNGIGSLIPGLTVFLYIGIPFVVSGLLYKLRKDGKKIHNYLWDLGVYLITIKFPKKRYCNDEVVLYSNEIVQLEPVYYEKSVEEEYAVKHPLDFDELPIEHEVEEERKQANVL
ncbi:conjugal transfer protein [Bacillus sp. V2I10]|uniref:conjugal transfer protein n=1 Tax=Bacillus sp. V2I10 TaxID=3042276 RepID=UPI0027854A64|nr:conjugal transfer protein [Bacillus sp. V2I10]MDQ0862370.1 hypothetical protein [Bacillus sp. V2I10]